MPKSEIDQIESHNLRVKSTAYFAKNIALFLWGAAGLAGYLHGWDAIWLIVGYAIGGGCCFGFALYVLGKLLKVVEND